MRAVACRPFVNETSSHLLASQLWLMVALVLFFVLLEFLRNSLQTNLSEVFCEESC